MAEADSSCLGSELWGWWWWSCLCLSLLRCVTSDFALSALSRPPVDRLQITDYEPDYQTVGLSWSRVDIPPFDREDEPLLYMIEYREPQADVWHTLVSGLPTTRYRVPDIGPAQDYQFRVRAMTPYGVSPPSHPAGLYRQASELRKGGFVC